MRPSSLAAAVVSAALAANLAFVPSAQAAPAAPAVKGAAPGAAKGTTAKGAAVKYVVVSLGRQSGSYVATTAPDGTVDFVLHVVENGRGPHVEGKLRLAPDGTLTSLTATGHHTFGNKIDERFSREGDHLRWDSSEEHGSRDLHGSAFFVPISPQPEVYGWLVRALLKAGGRLPLLPGGEARLEKTTETEVVVGKEKRKLVGYAISGIDLTRTHVWMNADGSWFGLASPWFSVVPAGAESAIEPLIKQQDALDRAHDAAVASAHAHKLPAAGLAYTHARVLDVERGAWVADQTVIVVGDTIRAVGPAAAVKVPAGAEVVDLQGKALLPGLWDMHAHLGDADGVLDIASGVTTVRDVGNDPDKLDDYKRRYDAGSAVGPHVFRMGFIEGRNEKAASSKVTAETEAEAKAGVAEYAKRGYDGIKIYNSVKPELVPLLAKEAHARGMSVTGHIPVHMLANEAVRAGYDCIEHVNMLFLNFFATHETDTRDTTRFTLVGDKAAAFDLASAPVRDFVQLLLDKHTVIDPTVAAFEDLLVAEPGKVAPGLESTVARLPVQTQRGFLIGGLPRGDKGPLYRASYDKLLAMVKLLVDRKVPVVAGTDALAGLFLHHELALMVRAGLTPAQALRTATIVPAQVMKRDKQSGSIAAGKAADLVVVDGDPLARIADVSNVVSTMRGGVVFPSAALYTTVGVLPAKR